MVWRALSIVILLTAGAAAEDMRTVAQQKFSEGRREFDAHNYQRALELLKESYTLAPYPDLLFNIGRCYEQLGQYRAALDAYQRYLAVNPADEDVRRRADAIADLAAAEPPPAVSPSPEPSQAALLAPELLSTSAPPPARKPPIYRRWWLWTAVVGGVAAVALGVGLGVGLSGASPSRTFPPLGAQ